MSPPVSVTKNQQQPYIQTATNCFLCKPDITKYTINLTNEILLPGFMERIICHMIDVSGVSSDLLFFFFDVIAVYFS
jgi:hypothetical protein